MQKKKLLIIGLVWPEPTSSAAGTRMMQLIYFFLSKNYDITFACAALQSEFSIDLNSIDVKEDVIKLTSESFNHFIKDLNPEIAALIDKSKIPTALINKKISILAKANIGFGDVNACIIFKKYDNE